MKNKFAFILILLSAFFIRIFSLNWDQGFHLHPDERMLIMVADRINFFRNLNPDFFNYGSLPIYLLKGFSQMIDFLFHKNLANYAGMLLTGRSLAVFFDLITICTIYKIGQFLFKSNKIALFSSLLYGIAFFPIQNSHFFVVDVLLNTFITGLIYILLTYFKSPSMKKIFIISLVFAAMMATKFTSVIFYPIVIGVLVFKNLKKWRNLFFGLLIFHYSFFIFHFLFMPYAFIEYVKFISDIKAQVMMNSNPYVFPYTLQYVGTIPYLYYLKNIFLWGLGPIITLLSIAGFLIVVKFSISNFQFSIKSKFLNIRFQILFFIFYFLYFLVIGRSSVKFMRYMLPLYPFFAILAGFGLYKLYEACKLLAYAFIACALLWSFMFLNIYSFPHTRISATDWILKNIPEGSTLAVEHWDDRVPTYGGEKYQYQELTLYDQPDDENKWEIIDQKLQKSDYIIIASNRLYVPLQKLTDCKKYKVCYLKTAEYYQKLFSNKLHFKKVAEFSSYPNFQFLNFKFQISDDSADESFTVYDHPKILIFKKSE
ncbi:MAG: glycosyltransferase family 39 protein [Patescibacteria group bacterium]|jgi:hypothetical protein